jgi:hypothetical protein
MSHRVYYIGIGAKTTQIDTSVKLVDLILDSLGDWVRLNDRTWFCSTDYSSRKLYEEIHDRMPWLERIMIVALDPTDRFGLAPDWIWEWIDGQRQTPPKTAAAIIDAGSSAHKTEAARGPEVHQTAEG